MKQIPCYERAPYLTELEVEVVEVDGAHVEARLVHRRVELDGLLELLDGLFLAGLFAKLFTPSSA